MSYRVDRTLADFIAGALSPPLIMTLVGSLVFFLLEIAYQGDYRGSLQWALFFFVFGAVLVARISMLGDLSGKAGLYGLVLGGAMWLVLQTYVDYGDSGDLARRAGFVNLGLIVLIWWSAHQLTSDSTFVDDDAGKEGVGLLEAAGFDRPAGAPRSLKKNKQDSPGFDGWVERFRRYWSQRSRRPRTQGKWVVLFSLAALPLFGLGQAQIPASDVERRTYVFRLLVLYVGAGLSLLMTTSFLGLRCYLRQRKVSMPVPVTLVWLLFGAFLIVTVLFVSDRLPRPNRVEPLWGSARADGAARDPSRISPFDARKEDDEAKESANRTRGDDKGKQTKGEAKSAEKSAKKEDARDADKGDRREPEANAKNTPSATPKPTPPSWAPPVLGPILAFLLMLAKWIVLAVVAAIVLFLVLRGLLQFLANFTFWANRLLAFLENFWLNLQVRAPASEGDTPAARTSTPRPFSSFSNPFRDGRGQYLSAAELVSYTFAAWQAWGREQDMPREPSDTVFDFARRTARAHPALGEEADRLAEMYGQLAYSTETPTPAQVKSLRTFWAKLERRAKGSADNGSE